MARQFNFGSAILSVEGSILNQIPTATISSIFSAAESVLNSLVPANSASATAVQSALPDSTTASTTNTPALSTATTSQSSALTSSTSTTPSPASVISPTTSASRTTGPTATTYTAPGTSASSQLSTTPQPTTFVTSTSDSSTTTLSTSVSANAAGTAIPADRPTDKHLDIILPVVFGVLLLFLLLTGICCCRRRRPRNKRAASASTEPTPLLIRKGSSTDESTIVVATENWSPIRHVSTRSAHAPILSDRAPHYHSLDFYHNAVVAEHSHNGIESGHEADFGVNTPIARWSADDFGRSTEVEHSPVVSPIEPQHWPAELEASSLLLPHHDRRLQRPRMIHHSPRVIKDEAWELGTSAAER